MKESMNDIIKYDEKLNSHISDITKFLNQASKANIYPLSKLDNLLMKTMEDAQNIKQK